MYIKKSIVSNFKKNGVVKVKNLVPKKVINKCLKELFIKKDYKSAQRDGNVVFDSFGKKKNS